MKKWLVAVAIAAVITGSILLGLTARLINPNIKDTAVTLLVFSGAMVISSLATTLLFFFGVQRFTAKFKTAYAIFCLGILLLALSELQIPIAVILNVLESAWFTKGFILIPVILSVGCMYAGVRSFARLFGVTGIWSKPWFVVIASVSVGFGCFFLPTGPAIRSDELAAQGTAALLGISTMIFLACAILAHNARRHATVTYARALQWFAHGLNGITLATFFQLVSILTVGTAHWWLEGGYSIGVLVVLSLPLLWAAYEFNVSSGAVDTGKTTEQSYESATILDIVIAAAKRASSIEAIDPMLNTVRTITATSAPHTTLSADNEAVLIKTYQAIEHYLTETDPVRRYTKKELRSIIKSELNLTAHSFLDKQP